MSPAESLPIAVCSWSLQVASIPELADYLSRLGLRHVHIACGDPHHATWRENDGMPQAARAAGFEMTGAMLGFPGEDYTTPQTIQATGGFGPTELRESRLNMLKWGLSRTQELGLSDLSLHAGFIPPPGSRERSDFLRTLVKAATLAEDAGIILGCETGQESAELLKRTLDEVASDHLRVNFDPANMLLYDMGDPLAGVELLGPYIRRVHVKDAVRPSAPGQWGKEVPLGHGQVDIPAFAERLWHVGYRGPLAIEREVGDQESRLRDIAAGVAVLRSAIQNITA